MSEGIRPPKIQQIKQATIRGIIDKVQAILEAAEYPNKVHITIDFDAESCPVIRYDIREAVARKYEEETT
jgi:hypothetical protein